MPPQALADFRILGPLEVTTGSPSEQTQRLDLGGTRQQVVLAMLLLNVGHAVSPGRLEQAIYGEDLPPTSRSQAQMSISSLRHLFATHGCEVTISRQPQGYVLGLGGGRLDAQRFSELTDAARAARDSDNPEQAVANYRDALRLWRGPALEGMDSLLVRAAAARLDEQRINAIEDRLALELDLGRHYELVGELTGLTEEFALRERLRGQLMLALYRSGRAAEALTVYQQARRLMIEDLGIEPGAALQRLQHAILVADPALDPPAGRAAISFPAPRVPRLLPAAIADFTGRGEQISQIGQRLTPAVTSQERFAVPVLVITGKGGVGKTSLAVQSSHLLAGQFSDGQLFADLHGSGEQITGPAQVLERFLLALGVPGSQIPEDLDARADAYRGLLAGRRTLVVLDDAATESQVAPLLPGSGEAAVLITSRSPLTTLAGATRIVLDVFDASQSLDLLGRIAGTGRVQAESEQAAVVARQCGHLPLALRIAGARLAVRPHWGIAQLADRLGDQARRLDELELGEIGVRASISLSYQAASEQARRLMRRLALLASPVFSGWVSAALLDQPPAEAEDILDDLLRAQLAETVRSEPGGPVQYRFHELILLFARERLEAEEPAAEQRAALERVLGALLYLAEAARDRFHGSGNLTLESSAKRWPLPASLTAQLVSDPIAWFEQERIALVAGVRQAAHAGLTELCWSLAMSAETGFESGTYLDDWQQPCEMALKATRDARNIRGQAAMLYSRGSLHQEQGRFEASRHDLDVAAQLFQQVGDDYGFALSIRLIAIIDRISGRLDEAASGFERALAILRSQRDQVAMAYVLFNLARVKLESHEPDTARALLTEARLLTEDAPLGRVKAQVLHANGEAQLRAGDLAGAADAFARTLEMVRDLRDQIGQAHVLSGVGIVALRQGRLSEAREALERAVELADTTGIPLAAARARLGLSELALARGDYGQAIVQAKHASDAFRDISAPREQAQALTLLADAYLALGDTTAAEVASAEATALTDS